MIVKEEENDRKINIIWKKKKKRSTGGGVKGTMKIQQNIFSLPEVLNSNGAGKVLKYIIVFSLNK